MALSATFTVPLRSMSDKFCSGFSCTVGPTTPTLFVGAGSTLRQMLGLGPPSTTASMKGSPTCSWLSVYSYSSLQRISSLRHGSLYGLPEQLHSAWFLIMGSI